MIEINFEEASSILEYDPLTGYIERKEKKFNTLSGKDRKIDAKEGYKIITIKGRKYQEHRLAWLLYYGKYPNGVIDHINGVKTDNRIANLRDVSNRENQQNMKSHRENNRLPGCSFITKAKKKKWRARVFHEGKSIHLGYYYSEKEAFSAYIKKVDSLTYNKKNEENSD